MEKGSLRTLQRPRQYLIPCKSILALTIRSEGNTRKGVACRYQTIGIRCTLRLFYNSALALFVRRSHLLYQLPTHTIEGRSQAALSPVQQYKRNKYICLQAQESHSGR